MATRYSRITTLLQAWLTEVLAENEWWTEDNDSVIVRTEHSGVTDDGCSRIARVVFTGSFPRPERECADCLALWDDTWRIELVQCLNADVAYSENESSNELELQEIVAAILQSFRSNRDSLKDPFVASSRVAITSIIPIDLMGGDTGYAINFAYERRMALEDNE